MDALTKIQTIKDTAKDAGRELTGTETRRIALLEVEARVQAQEKNKPNLGGLLSEKP
jgi:hypothetical protein